MITLPQFSETIMASSAVPPRKRVLFWLVLCLLLGGSLGAAYYWFRPSPSSNRSTSGNVDPRLSYAGPFRNVHPDTHYVGDAACESCHSDRCEQFHQHAMGRSLLPLNDWLSSAKVKPAQPFKGFQSRFTVEPEGKRVWHKQEHLDKDGKVIVTTKRRVDYVIGSGHHGHSFFTDRDGYLYQTPISWFKQKGVWDVSPGFMSSQLRPVIPECLFCHSGGAKPIEQTVNHYEEPIFTSASITCERCHGPASLHVEERNRSLKVKLPDYTIVNPKHLSAELREDVCHQCHLAGEIKILRRGRGLFDYRPGLPLPEFFSVYVSSPDVPVKQRAVGQVEQLTESKCYTHSSGRLGCATCHDPHEALPADQRVSHHRRKCLECHETKNLCSLDRTERLKTTKEDSCIDCHMKRNSAADIAHTAVTNHRIERVPTGEANKDQPQLPGQPLIRLDPFHKDRRGEVDADRDLGMALVLAASRKQAFSNPALPRALALLERARKRAPDDVPLLESLSTCFVMMNLTERLPEVSEAILAVQPRNAQALYFLGYFHLDRRDYDQAVKYLEKARVESPQSGVIVSSLVRALIKKQQYDRAADVCRAQLELEAGVGETWAMLAHCQGKLGKPAEAAESQNKADRLGGFKFTE
jgi:hypothetical protein